MHPAGGGMQGYAPDVEIAAKELLRTQRLLHTILAKHTGQPVEQIQRDFDRDFFMDADSAKKYGIVDEILIPPSDKVPASVSEATEEDQDGHE
jgi:ATP-dependent Clp protease protease subunit